MRPCPSFPGYSATDDGQIISHRRRGKGRQHGSASCIDSDNRPGNLKYGTQLDNAADRKAHGTYLGGSNHHGAKLSGGQAAAIRRRRRQGEKVVADLAKEFGVSISTVETLLAGKSYQPVEFKRVTP